MTVRPEFPFSAKTEVEGLAFAAMRMVMLHEAKEHELPVLENSKDRVTIQLSHGLYSFGATETGISIDVSATKVDWLHTLKDSLLEHLEHSVPDAARGIRWSDSQDAGQNAGALPPNFHFVTVQSVEPLGPCFLRLRVKGKDLTSFQEDAIHFRVILPPAGLTDVEWPYLAENGATVWPKGEKALHRPVYTTRWIDHATGLMDFDVFIHEGGRITEWARQVSIGDRVGVTGPGGGGIPKTDQITLFADETGFPAAARVLESLPPSATGMATFLADDPTVCEYPIAAPKGIAMTWLSRNQSDSLGQAALAGLETFKDGFFWMAGEKADVQKVRAAFKEADHDPNRAYIAAYWTAS